MTTKLERMVTYLEELLPVKPYDALILWSYEILKANISSSPKSQFL